MTGDTINQVDLTDTYRTFFPNVKEYTFFSGVHGTFSKSDHVLGYKAGLNNYRKTEIMPSVVTDHGGLKLDINSNRNYRRNTNS